MRSHQHHKHDGDHDGRMGISPTRYDGFVRLLRRSYRRLAADAAVDLPHGCHVLDIGTGTGQFVVALARLRPDLEITGIDVDPAMIEVATRNLSGAGNGVRALVGDVADLSTFDSRIDAVVSTLSLHHWPDPVAGGAEIRRLLGPDGRVAVYDFGGAPFDDLAQGMGTARAERLTKVRITPLPWPVLHRFAA